MGAMQSSKQEIDNIVSVVSQSWSSTSESVALVVNCQNSIKTSDACTSAIIENVTQDCSMVGSLSQFVQAVQKSTNSTDVDNQIKQQVKQSVQNMSFNFTAQDENQITKNLTDICTQIYESVASSSVTSMAFKNEIVCEAGGLYVYNAHQTSAINICITSTMKTDQASSSYNKVVDIVDQYASQEQENSLYAIFLILLGVAAVLASPAVGAGYFVAKSGKNKVVLIMLAVVFLVTTNLYLRAECIKHSFPWGRLPPFTGKWSIPIFPKWCDSTELTIGTFGFTWVVFGLMIWLAYRRDVIPNAIAPSPPTMGATA